MQKTTKRVFWVVKITAGNPVVKEATLAEWPQEAEVSVNLQASVGVLKGELENQGWRGCPTGKTSQLRAM